MQPTFENNHVVRNRTVEETVTLDIDIYNMLKIAYKHIYAYKFTELITLLRPEYKNDSEAIKDMFFLERRTFQHTYKVKEYLCIDLRYNGFLWCDEDMLSQHTMMVRVPDLPYGNSTAVEN